VIASLLKICMCSSNGQRNIGMSQDDVPSLLFIINNSGCIRIVDALYLFQLAIKFALDLLVSS
jgi:hypothetical protein